MRKVYSAVLGAIFAITAQPVSADPLVVGEYYDYPWKIQVDQYLFVALTRDNSRALAASHGCANTAFARSAEPITSESTKAMLKLALAAYLSRSVIYIRTSGCTGGDGNVNNPSAGYPKFTAVQLQQ
ncbi:MAG: hypothetical protein AAFR71_10460 [Pseudomonadota bacterium]